MPSLRLTLGLALTFAAVAAQPQAAAEMSLIRTARSGPWSAATTWEGNAVPGAHARVQIREGHGLGAA